MIVEAHYKCEFCQREFVVEFTIDKPVLEWLSQCPFRHPHPCSPKRIGVAHLIGAVEEP